MQEAAKLLAKLKSKGKKNLPSLDLDPSPPTSHVREVAYVELATGLLVRSERESNTKGDDPIRVKTISVVQRLTPQ